MLIQIIRISVFATSIMLTSGCSLMSSMDYRPDGAVKKPLTTLQTTRKVSENWSSKIGSGRGANYSNLQLAKYNDWLIGVDCKGRMVAFDSSTGKEVWSNKLDSEITAGPSINNDNIYVGVRKDEIFAVCAVSASTGKKLWQTNVSGELLAAPEARDGQIVVHTLDSAVTTLNSSDGRVLWSYALPAQSLLVLRRGSTPKITDKHIINGFASGQLAALNRRDGTLDWRQAVALPKGKSDIQRMIDIAGQPLVQQEKIYVVTYQGKLACFNEDNGELVWSRQMSSDTGITYAERKLYVADTEGDVWCVGAENGELLWKMSDLSGRRLTRPVIQGKLLVVADDDGYVHWLTTDSGKCVARRQFKKVGIEAAPIVQGSKLYVLDRKGQLTAFEIDNIG